MRLDLNREADKAKLVFSLSTVFWGALAQTGLWFGDSFTWTVGMVLGTITLVGALLLT